MSDAGPARTLLWLTNAGALADGRLATYAAWLGEAERERLARFVRPLRRRQFIAGRALLRLALGRLLDVAPQSILLEERAGNAPVLVAPVHPDAGFSISHSGAWAACAAGTGGAIGLDIECIDPSRDVLALADQAFGPQAAASLRALGDAARIDAFYRMWCLHEAEIKLGRPSVAHRLYAHPGLALALCHARPGLPPAQLEIVTL